MLQSDPVGEHLVRLPVILHQRVPQVYPDVAGVNVVHAHAVDVLQIPHRVRVPSRDEDQVTRFLYASVNLSVFEQWELVVVRVEGVRVEVRPDRAHVDIDQIVARIEAPLLPPTEEE
eukprot:CAMPEP_0179318730 /NCGR_PEP_ID=MMETSP0797-20121207/57071_1 /TAXON_ID=47934 /ORGANISM="Dinophysis acuminata, Strain DAEP01" /LENGTH=116 /DNA_ID=CAMNT_0021029981 /DNA_START=56 /DNA_END=406 /DNA_ORIENTATION=+